MKQRFFAPSAINDVTEVHDHIAADSASNAERFVDACDEALGQFDERFVLKTVKEFAPAKVYKMRVPGFVRYWLWIAVSDEVVAIIAVFRPGLTSDQMIDRGTKGLNETN